MLDTSVQCVLLSGANCAHRLPSSSRARSSSTVQVLAVVPVASADPRQLDAISNFGTPPAGRRELDGRGRVAGVADPVVSAGTFAQAAMSGLLCAPRVRQEACRSVCKVAASRRLPQ